MLQTAMFVKLPNHKNWIIQTIGALTMPPVSVSCSDWFQTHLRHADNTAIHVITVSNDIMNKVRSAVVNKPVGVEV